MSQAPGNEVVHNSGNSYEPTHIDRRIFRWKLDKNINVSALIGLIILFWTIVSYGNAIIEAQRVTGQKVNIMWEYFIKDKPELTYLFK